MNTVDEIKREVAENYVTYIKYVRIGDELRFAFSGVWGEPDHKSMVKEGEKATSAAYFKVYRPRNKPAYVEIEGWSMSLNLYAAPDDQALLEKLFLNCT